MIHLGIWSVMMWRQNVILICAIELQHQYVVSIWSQHVSSICVINIWHQYVALICGINIWQVINMWSICDQYVALICGKGGDFYAWNFATCINICTMINMWQSICGNQYVAREGTFYAWNLAICINMWSICVNQYMAINVVKIKMKWTYICRI